MMQDPAWAFGGVEVVIDGCLPDLAHLNIHKFTSHSTNTSHRTLTYIQTHKTYKQVTMTSNNTNNAPDSKTYRQQAGEYYNTKYETWMPWIEDKYLSWFTKDNKASYAAKRMFYISFTSIACDTLLEVG